MIKWKFCLLRRFSHSSFKRSHIFITVQFHYRRAWSGWEVMKASSPSTSSSVVSRSLSRSSNNFPQREWIMKYCSVRGLSMNGKSWPFGEKQKRLPTSNVVVIVGAGIRGSITHKETANVWQFCGVFDCFHELLGGQQQRPTDRQQSS